MCKYTSEQELRSLVAIGSVVLVTITPIRVYQCSLVLLITAVNYCTPHYTAH